MASFKPKTICRRGHKITGANLKLRSKGKSCRACECALSWKHRQAQLPSDRQVQQYADKKLLQLLATYVPTRVS